MFRYQKTSSVLAFLLTFSISMISTVRTDAQEWKQYADPAKAGWSADRLEKARKLAVEIGSGAVLIVDKGNVVAAWGHIDHPYKAASMRKSIYDGTFGAVYLEKAFNVNTKIGELGIDDLGGLTETEKKATLEQLMEARSGVYHPAAYETRSNAERRPERGSHPPGTFWYYNNWDFNAVCAVFQKISGSRIEDGFKARIAEPLGMEDFESDHVFRWLEPRASIYPAVTFRISARDLARFGKLYIEGGTWNGKRLIPADWIKRSTSAITVFGEDHYRGESNGYGRLWWVYPARPNEGSAYEKYRRIAARGAGGQMMVLVPELDVIIVHLADTDAGDGVPDNRVAELMNLILEARSEGPLGGSDLAEVTPEKLSGTAPAQIERDLSPVSGELVSEVEGTYLISEKVGIRLYEFNKRLFAQPIGMPLPDVEVFLAKDGSLHSPIANVEFEPVMANGVKATKLKMTFRGRTQTGQRVD
jgi:CubicO group peptidase (beta-lactamase class C family)